MLYRQCIENTRKVFHICNIKDAFYFPVPLHVTGPQLKKEDVVDNALIKKYNDYIFIHDYTDEYII